MKFCQAVVLVVIFALPFYRSAAAESAEELLSACTPIADAKVRGDTIRFTHDFDSGECWGAFATLQQVSRYADPHSGQRLLPIGCPPPESTRSELIAVFVEYARRHPEQRHDDFVNVTLDALQTAYPCVKTK